jgi:hypothetical protein
VRPKDPNVRSLRSDSRAFSVRAAAKAAASIASDGGGAVLTAESAWMFATALSSAYAETISRGPFMGQFLWGLGNRQQGKCRGRVAGQRAPDVAFVFLSTKHHAGAARLLKKKQAHVHARRPAGLERRYGWLHSHALETKTVLCRPGTQDIFIGIPNTTSQRIPYGFLRSKSDSPCTILFCNKWAGNDPS